MTKRDLGTTQEEGGETNEVELGRTEAPHSQERTVVPTEELKAWVEELNCLADDWYLTPKFKLPMEANDPFPLVLERAEAWGKVAVRLDSQTVKGERRYRLRARAAPKMGDDRERLFVTPWNLRNEVSLFWGTIADQCRVREIAAEKRLARRNAARACRPVSIEGDWA